MLITCSDIQGNVLYCTNAQKAHEIHYTQSKMIFIRV